MHWGNGRSVKAERRAVNGSEAQTHLAQNCFEAWCGSEAGRATLPKRRHEDGAEFHIEQTQKASFGFVLVLLCCCCAPWLFTHTTLFKLTHFSSSCFLLFYIRSYFFKLWEVWRGTGALPGSDLGYPSGVSQRAAVTSLSLLQAQVKCHVLSGRLWSHLRAEQRAERDVWSSRLPVLARGTGSLLGLLCRASRCQRYLSLPSLNSSACLSHLQCICRLFFLPKDSWTEVNVFFSRETGRYSGEN